MKFNLKSQIMRKIYFLFYLLTFLTFNTFSQGSEDFTSSEATASYASGNYLGNNGISWTYVHSRNEGVFSINGKGLILRRANEPSSLSASISGGIANFSVNTRKAFRGNKQRKLELVVNGAVVGQFEPTYMTGEDATIVPFIVNDINIPGDANITLRLYGSKGNQQIVIDDIEWTGFSGPAMPSLSITSPTEGEELVPSADVLVDFKTLNFNIATAGNGDGHLKYILDGGTANMTYTSNPINLGSLSAGPHSVVIELVDDSSNPLSPAVSKTVNFTVAALTQVADIAALRDDVTLNGAGGYYQITGESLVTHTDSHQNRKWVQDTNISGVLIYDTAGVINTTYNVGDLVTGLTGYTALASGVLRFIPSSDSGIIESSGNPVTPQIVTILDLNATPDNYESELIALKNVTFVTGDGLTTFNTEQNYDLTDGANTIQKRADFSDANYIGALIPSSELSTLIAIAGQFNGNAQVYARSLDDIVLSVTSFEINNFKVYPNPTATGSVKISSKESGTIAVEVYDILGKSIIKQATLQNETLDVSRLHTGIYILKITQNEASLTKKLVIE